MKSIHAICLILCFVFSVHAHAATETKHQSQGSQSELVIEQTSTRDQIALLKEQLKLIKSFQDNLLSTVFWALGTVITIAALLIGFGWFANFRIYERDKAALAREMQLLIDAENRKLNETVQTYLNKNIPEIIGIKIKQTFEPFQDEYEKKLAAFDKKLAETTYRILKREHQDWIDQKVYANALRFSTDILALAIDSDFHWSAAATLDLIQSDLNHIIASNQRRSLDAYLISYVMDVLDKVGSEHSIVVSTIKNTLSTIKNRDNQE